MTSGQPAKRGGIGQHAEGRSRPDSADAHRPARVRADALLAGRRELVIEHGEQEYRLRLTSNGKLLLTK